MIRKRPACYGIEPGQGVVGDPVEPPPRHEECVRDDILSDLTRRRAAKGVRRNRADVLPVKLLETGASILHHQIMSRNG
jgi:hypothetical protein